MTRIAVWSTGAVASIAVRAIHARQDLELVGVWVHSDDKVSRDAGELVGLGPIGVRTTQDAAEILAARPRHSTKRKCRAYAVACSLAQR